MRIPRRDTIKQAIRLPVDLAKSLDDFKFEVRLPSTAEAIRVALKTGLDTAEAADE